MWSERPRHMAIVSKVPASHPLVPIVRESSRRRGSAEPGLPPIDRDESLGELKGAVVELLRELRDHDDPVRERVAGDPAGDLNGGAATGTTLPTGVLRRIRVVKQTDQPTDVAG